MNCPSATKSSVLAVKAVSFRSTSVTAPRSENCSRQTGNFDALICAAGSVNFVPLATMTEQDFELGLRDKLMGQVNLLLIGRGTRQ